MRKTIRFAILTALELAGMTTARADPPYRFVHVFNQNVPLGGYFPGPVLGHQTSADPQSWALYGATLFGGDHDTGVIYKLTPPAAGSTNWTETRLYVFPRTEAVQSFARLAIDPSGALYGGANGDCSTVFKLAPPTTGYFWTKTTIYTGSCGALAAYSLAVDTAGAVYVGTSDSGGQLIRLAPPPSGNGAWPATVLHSFSAYEGNPTHYPVVFGAAGEIYGTTAPGTGPFFGSVYRLSPPAPGQTSWHYETILSVWSRSEAARPAALLYDSSGTLYGTGYGEPESHPLTPGGVFSLQPPGPGQTAWTKTPLFRFSDSNGSGVNSLVRFSSTGPLYGTTDFRAFLQSADPGSRTLAGGVVFELDPPSGSGTAWTEKALALTNTYDGGLNGPVVREPGGALVTSSMLGNLKYGVFTGDAGTILRVGP